MMYGSEAKEGPRMLFETLPVRDSTPINNSLSFADRDGVRVVYWRGLPLYRVILSDSVHLRFVAVQLRLSGLASQAQIVTAFGHAEESQRRWERAFQEEGFKGLQPRPRSGRPRKLDVSHDEPIRRWFAQGLGPVEIARRLGVSHPTVCRTLERLGLVRQANAQPPLPMADGEQEPKNAALSRPTAADVETEPLPEPTRGSAPSVAVPEPESPDVRPTLHELTVDQDPTDRSGDRAMAQQGMLADAVPLFADMASLPRAGVFLAVPLLREHGIVDAFKEVYQTIGPAFYGLRTTVVALTLFALLRIRRPEQLKEHAPVSLGRLLGLDRAPEVKTVRRKLGELADRQRGQQVMDAVAQRRIAGEQDRLAFVYLDGHVREYHGKHAVPKTWKSQRRVIGSAATDLWVNDTKGEPLLVVHQEAHDSLTEHLEPVLDDLCELAPGAAPTAIFDRGGFSPKLFDQLERHGYDIITYEKGKTKELPRSWFEEHSHEADGKDYRYQLCDERSVQVGRVRNKRNQERKRQFMWMRRITVLRSDGRQTQILTTRQDLPAAEVAYRMFNRWRQENFLKYMNEEFALDALVEYGADPISEERDRPNPKHKELKQSLQEARSEVERLRAELGEAVSTNDEQARSTVRGFKIAHADLRRELEDAEARVEELSERLKATPTRIGASDQETLKTERREITDTIKMAAYQIESELLTMVRDCYKRAEDEGRTLLHAAFSSSASIEVTDDELRVTLEAQSSPHRSRAIADLCEKLNERGTTYPGTNLRVRLGVEGYEPVTSEEGVCQEV